jgi:hypothetical protein
MNHSTEKDWEGNNKKKGFFKNAWLDIKNQKNCIGHKIFTRALVFPNPSVNWG